jgi:predicted amidohydrolase
MKICLAQTKPVRGNIEANINNHVALIEKALTHQPDCIVFPELSLTAYEPSLAKQLLTNKDDKRLAIFEQISNQKQVVIGVGLPIATGAGITIGMVLFQPGQPRQVYAKKYLHADEEPFFVSGENYTGLQINGEPVALAVCYELSIAQHVQDAHERGAAIYLASVAKTAKGVMNARATLAGYAGRYSMTVLLVNSVGMCEDGLCAGQSCAWNKKGQLMGQLDDSNEGLLLVNTHTQEAIVL